MSKKIKFKSPQEQKELAENWVHKNTDKGENVKQDTHEKQKNRNSKNSKSMQKIQKKEENADDENRRRLTVDMPKDLHKAFKKIAVINEVHMVDLLRSWIEDFVDENS